MNKDEVVSYNVHLEMNKKGVPEVLPGPLFTNHLENLLRPQTLLVVPLVV